MIHPPTLNIWPARYKTSTLEIHESQRHQVWIASSDVKKVLPTLRSDSQLVKVHSTDFRSLDKGKRIYFSERALKKELQSIRTQEALMFLEWLEKTVYYPAARKRGDAEALQPMPQQSLNDEQRHNNENLHIQVRKLPPLSKSAHMKRVAIHSTETSSYISHYILKPLLGLWRGEVEMSRTIFFGGLVLIAWVAATGFLIEAITNPTHYAGAYIWRQWSVLFLLLQMGGVVAWWCIGIMRCAIRRQHEGRSIRASLGGFVFGFTVLLYMIPIPVALAFEWMEGWWATVHGALQVAEVVHDKFLGRIVVRGELGFGTYKRLESALSQAPILTLVEVDSPGGYVAEGLAMARLLEKVGADTVAFDECASACTFLLAAGKERYLGPKSEVGFHRSWSRALGFGNGWSITDHRIAEFYRSRGASEEFIKHALDTPGYDLWLPTQGQMFTSGYATKRWDERKAGY